MSRLDKDQYFLKIAQVVALRSTCIRRQYGAVIVSANGTIVSTGYNGAPSGEPNCCDVGYCWREAYNIPHGQRYESCNAIHSEQNAINFANCSDMQGATLYLAGWENGVLMDNPQPCKLCSRSIKNFGIARVVTGKETPDA